MRLSQLLNQKAAADLLNVSERTLERWRVEGSGPPFMKAGRRVLYRESDIEAWLNASKVTSTSETVVGS